MRNWKRLIGSVRSAIGSRQKANRTKQKIKLERIIENHNHSISEINLRIKKFTDDKKRSEHDIHELSELIDASSKGANKYETKIKFYYLIKKTKFGK